MIHERLSDVHILGDQTRHTAIRSAETEKRDWLSESPICRLLETHNILHAGIMLAWPPFTVVRTQQSGTFFLACFGGEGSILVDGNWHKVTQNMACLLPPHTVNALRSDGHWDFAWVRYFEPRGVVPVATANSPAQGEFNATPVKNAIEGLHAECMGDASTAVLHHWAELTHQYVQRFVRPRLTDNRIWKAWEAVEKDLGHDWSLNDISGVACVSPEHLRRLCLKHLGRSPMKHLTYLRMRHAAELLSATDEKIETITHSVGYENAFAFSDTFLKWTGMRPSEHR
ncbi:helix-turn-helix transcriptional regulator [bacterium]|nr:helix-turn-helix transcriptional regulator [bacterium]